MASSSENTQHTLGLILIIIASLIFSSTFPVIRKAVDGISPEILVAARLTPAALIFIPFLRNLNTHLIRDGVIVGIFLWGLYSTEAFALESIPANQAAFTVALSVVFVTLFEFVSGKRLSYRVIIAAAFAFTGVGIISWGNVESLTGEVWLFICALLDSAYILVLERFAPLHPPLQLSAVSLWVPSILSLLLSLPQLNNQIEPIKDNLGAIIYLTLVATVIFTYVETLGQRWIPGHEVAIFRAMDPVFAAIFSFWLLGETFELHDFIGAAMVLIAMILVLIRNRGGS